MKKLYYTVFVSIIILYITFRFLCIINEKFLSKHELVFYTCFFGQNNNIANKIPTIPSNYYDCYYFTNNKSTYDLLQNTKWICIFVDIPIKDTDTENAMDAKELKACPHHFDILNKYDYNCYFDSKIYVDEYKVNDMINNILKISDYLYIIPIHPFIKNSVWDEYNECLLQERYAIEKDKYFNYINKQLNSGLLSTDDVHYTTHFIIIKNTPKTNEINELWFEHIKECGIECQISFFFIQQIYKKYIYRINTYSGYKY